MEKKKFNQSIVINAQRGIEATKELIKHLSKTEPKVGGDVGGEKDFSGAYRFVFLDPLSSKYKVQTVMVGGKGKDKFIKEFPPEDILDSSSKPIQSGGRMPVPFDPVMRFAHPVQHVLSAPPPSPYIYAHRPIPPPFPFVPVSVSPTKEFEIDKIEETDVMMSARDVKKKVEKAFNKFFRSNNSSTIYFEKVDLEYDLAENDRNLDAFILSANDPTTGTGEVNLIQVNKLVDAKSGPELPFNGARPRGGGPRPRGGAATTQTTQANAQVKYNNVFTEARYSEAVYTPFRKIYWKAKVHYVKKYHFGRMTHRDSTSKSDLVDKVRNLY